MVDLINAATPAPNAFPDVENNNNGQKNQEEISDVQTEETSHVNSIGEAENNEKVSNAQAKETDRRESAQRDNEANAKSPAAQDESRGTIVDILS
jgi:hypothetical protein